MPRKKTDVQTETESAVAPTAPKRPRVTAVVKRSDIIERRLKNPMGVSSRPIPSKEKDRDGKALLEFYIADRSVSPDYLRSLIYDKGWEYARPEDLDCPPEDFGFDVRDGRLVRGERGNEVLLKMRRDDRAAIMQAMAEKNRQQALGMKETKAAIVERASSELGDEPADFLHRAIGHMEVTDTMEKLPGDAESWESVKSA